jgi:hypothetical protein
MAQYNGYKFLRSGFQSMYEKQLVIRCRGAEAKR